MDQSVPPLHIVVTGAGRGLGLEFTRQWLTRGHRLFALARAPDASAGLKELTASHPGRLTVMTCDVTDPAQVGAAVGEVSRATDRIDLLLNNAGVAPEREEPLESLDLDLVSHAFSVNALAPLAVTRAFLPLVLASEKPMVVCISTQMASLTGNTDGLWYGYRMSKAALNMAVVNLSLELAGAGVIVVALHPGWVRTDMGGPKAPLEPAKAVEHLIETIDALAPEASGSFLDYRGRALPW